MAGGGVRVLVSRVMGSHLSPLDARTRSGTVSFALHSIAKSKSEVMQNQGVRAGFHVGRGEPPHQHMGHRDRALSC